MTDDEQLAKDERDYEDAVRVVTLTSPYGKSAVEMLREAHYCGTDRDSFSQLLGY